MAQLPFLKRRGGRWWLWYKSKTSGRFVHRSTGINIDDLTAAVEFSNAIVRFRREYGENLRYFGLARQIHEDAATAYFEPLMPTDNSAWREHGTYIQWQTGEDPGEIDDAISTDEALRKTRRIEGDNVKHQQRIVELEAEVELLRKDLGLRKTSKYSYADALKEYLTWGKTQGKKRPWSKHHLRKQTAQTEWWTDRLKPKTLGDITLSKVEAECRTIPGAPRTRQSYFEVMSSFLFWCSDKNRRYLPENPLDGTNLDKTPQSTRRALTEVEITALLTKCRPQRRLLYELALSSGLRKNELMQLIVADLDVGNSALRLNPKWTKNRKAGWQELPEALTAKLAESVAGLNEKQPLIHVPADASARFKTDRRLAGIQHKTAAGVANFAALRQTFVTLCNDAGATAKGMQELARHSPGSPLTLGVYAKSRDSEKRAVVEKIGALIAAAV